MQQTAALEPLNQREGQINQGSGPAHLSLARCTPLPMPSRQVLRHTASLLQILLPTQLL